MLQSEFNYFLQNQKELVDKYAKKTIVIKDQKVIGVYDTYTEAYFETSKILPLGSFLIQRCDTTTTAHTHVFHSRVSF